jgi:signal transduction histidine kinase
LTKGPEAAEVWPEVGRQKRNGAGLNLVRDFVDRELRGKFSVISSVGKGTTARVEFALLTDEWNERGL